MIITGYSFGWVTPVNTSPAFDTSMGRSLDFSWLYVLGIRWNYLRHSISAGIGLDWRNYSLHRHQYYYKETDGNISLQPFGDDTNRQSSRLQTFSLQIPLLYQIGFGKHNVFHFAVGPVLNFNTGAHISTKYSRGNDRITNTTKGIGQNPVTVDIMSSFTFHQFGLYVRYAPMNVLHKRTGLDFNSLSTGIIITY